MSFLCRPKSIGNRSLFKLRALNSFLSLSSSRPVLSHSLSRIRRRRVSVITAGAAASMALFNSRLHGFWLLMASIAAGSSAAGFQSPMMQSQSMPPQMHSQMMQRPFQSAALPPGARYSSTPVMMPFQTETDSPLVTSVDPMQTAMMYQDPMMSGPQPSMPFGGDGDCGCGESGEIGFADSSGFVDSSGFQSPMGSECGQCEMSVGDCGDQCFNDPYNAPFGGYQPPMYGGCANDGMCPITPPAQPYAPLFQNPDYVCGDSCGCNTCCPCGNAPAFWDGS